MLIRFWASSPSAVWVKPVVVTDVVEDGSTCVEAARGLQELAGGDGGVG